MSIILAQECDLTIIQQISHTTIEEIYPHYYPSGATAFFHVSKTHLTLPTNSRV